MGDVKREGTALCAMHMYSTPFGENGGSRGQWRTKRSGAGSFENDLSLEKFR
jgi:hypothetical protein